MLYMLICFLLFSVPQIEPWFGTSYIEKEIPESCIEDWVVMMKMMRSMTRLAKIEIVRALRWMMRRCMTRLAKIAKMEIVMLTTRLRLATLSTISLVIAPFLLHTSISLCLQTIP
ncbi:unnamed protein product [Arabidopsis halleri]